jgi:cytochrome c oxidase subunit III
MNLWIASAALLTGMIVWWLLVRKLMTKSWERGPSATLQDQVHSAGILGTPPATIGLWVFLAVVTALFGLFIAAYYIRMGHGHGAMQVTNDWRAVREPPVLWINTVLLLLSSIAMHAAGRAVSRGQASSTRLALMTGGGLTILFLAGQLAAWQQLRSSGYLMSSNPAVAFFYVLTAVHGLHLLGGLWVWGRTLVRLWAGVELIDIHLSVKLCSVYWHYLLLVWLVLFALLLYT